MNHTPSRRSGRRAALPAPRPLLLWSAALALTLSGAGCGDSDDEDESAPGSDTSITIAEQRDGFSGESEHSWDSPGSTARVSLDIRNFHRGSVLVTILDATDAVVFSKVYRAHDWFWQLDGELSDVDFTEPGAVGEWAILLEYTEFTGDLTLVVDASDAPVDPEVPGPESSSELLDPGFGEDGRAAHEPDSAAARRLAVDSLGRIVACGTLVSSSTGTRRLAVWRYTAAGVLDRNFGAGGIRTYEGAMASGALDVTTDSVNRVLVSGWVAPGPERRTDLAVFRFTGLGSFDASFGQTGLMTLDDGEDEVGAAVAVDSIGRIVVAGTSRNEDDSAGYLLLVRLLHSGRLDVGFDRDGIVRTSDGTDRARDLVLAPGDQPLVLGTRDGSLILWKFTGGGGPDTSFGIDGIATGAGPPGELRVGSALAIKGDDGTLGVAGVRFREDGTIEPELALWRYEANGDPLLTFNQSGFITYAHPGGWAAGSGIGFDATDRLLVSGATRSSGTEETDASATLWRYFPSGAVDLSLPGSDDTGAARFDPRPQDAGTTASSLVLRGDGSALAAGAAFLRMTNAVDLVIWKLEP